MSALNLRRIQLGSTDAAAQLAHLRNQLGARGNVVSAISRDIATARARASLALRESERSAEYNVRLGARADLVDLCVPVAASVGTTPILTRLRSAKGPIQKSGFLITVAVRN